MSEYNNAASFGGMYFEVGDVTTSEQSGTLKTNIGKTFVEKNIPLRNNINIVLNIKGVITGLSRTSGQTLSTALEADRASLKALDDGYFHAYDDGKHSGNFVIVKESLIWDDEAARSSGQPYKFSMTLKEW